MGSQTVVSWFRRQGGSLGRRIVRLQALSSICITGIGTSTLYYCIVEVYYILVYIHVNIDPNARPISSFVFLTKYSVFGEKTILFRCFCQQRTSSVRGAAPQMYYMIYKYACILYTEHMIWYWPSLGTVQRFPRVACCLSQRWNVRSSKNLRQETGCVRDYSFGSNVWKERRQYGVETRSLEKDGQEETKAEEGSEQSMVERLAEKVEVGVQNVLAVILLAALGLSCANVLAKIGVITFALVSVSIRYTIVGILLVVLVVYVL